jgi:hypothetical protein
LSVEAETFEFRCAVCASVEVAFAFEAAMMGSARERIEREGVGAVRVAIA